MNSVEVHNRTPKKFTVDIIWDACDTDVNRSQVFPKIMRLGKQFKVEVTGDNLSNYIMPEEEEDDEDTGLPPGFMSAKRLKGLHSNHLKVTIEFDSPGIAWGFAHFAWQFLYPETNTK